MMCYRACYIRQNVFSSDHLQTACTPVRNVSNQNYSDARHKMLYLVYANPEVHEKQVKNNPRSQLKIRKKKKKKTYPGRLVLRRMQIRPSKLQAECCNIRWVWEATYITSIDLNFPQQRIEKRERPTITYVQNHTWYLVYTLIGYRGYNPSFFPHRFGRAFHNTAILADHTLLPNGTVILMREICAGYEDQTKPMGGTGGETTVVLWDSTIKNVGMEPVRHTVLNKAKHNNQGFPRCGFFLRCSAVRCGLTAPHRTILPQKNRSTPQDSS